MNKTKSILKQSRYANLYRKTDVPDQQMTIKQNKFDGDKMMQKKKESDLQQFIKQIGKIEKQQSQKNVNKSPYKQKSSRNVQLYNLARTEEKQMIANKYKEHSNLNFDFKNTSDDKIESGAAA
jgi:alpha-D-ribose 1-methylphosphonate 5-triphosphate synthase subunit PhnI